MGELAKAAEALSAPAVKLLDVVSRGIGRAYDPRYKRRMAEASAYEIDTLADAVRRNSDLPILLDRDGVQLDARSIQELAERTKTRLFSQEMRKQQNIEAIVDKAYEELKEDITVSDEPVDDDWIVRFFNSVEDVSNEKLREIWGRILAGEIRKPSSFKMRTLDVLKNISCEEALLFERISFCILECSGNAFVPISERMWENYGISFNIMYVLSDAGLINLAPHQIVLYIDKQDEIVSNKSVVCVLRKTNIPQTKPLRLNIHSLTETGKALLSVTSYDYEKNKTFALEYFKLLKENHKYCDVHAYQVTNGIDLYQNSEMEDLLEFS